VAWNYPYVGRWGVSACPQGWRFVPDFGIRQMSGDPLAITANVALTQEAQPTGETLLDYIHRQGEILQKNLIDLKLGGPSTSTFPGAEEAYLYLVQHRVKESISMLHVQHYVRSGSWIGIITLTTPEHWLAAVRPAFDEFVAGLCILAEPPPAPPEPGSLQPGT